LTTGYYGGGIRVHMMNTSNIDEAAAFEILKSLEKNPALSQRQLSADLGVSLGKVNFCLKALIGKGYLKVSNFRNSKNKRAYAYLLTPLGMEEKARMTLTFLQYKMQEYERLHSEIAALKSEAKNLPGEAVVMIDSDEIR